MTPTEYSAAVERARENASQVAAFNAFWAARAAEQNQARKAESDRRFAAFIDQTASRGLGVCVRAKVPYSPTPIPANRSLPKFLVWMPKGTHDISATTLAGESIAARVICDEQGARDVAASFALRTMPAFVDRNHDGGEAAAWVHALEWDPGLGIVARLTWTPLGEELVRNRRLISFSPTFLMNNESGRVSGVLSAGPIGGLVNAPAFGAAMPILSASGRVGSAELIRDTLLGAGHSSETADRIADAVAAGFDGAAIALLLETLSGRA